MVSKPKRQTLFLSTLTNLGNLGTFHSAAFSNLTYPTQTKPNQKPSQEPNRYLLGNHEPTDHNFNNYHLYPPGASLFFYSLSVNVIHSCFLVLFYCLFIDCLVFIHIAVLCCLSGLWSYHHIHAQISAPGWLRRIYHLS